MNVAIVSECGSFSELKRYMGTVVILTQPNQMAAIIC